MLNTIFKMKNLPDFSHFFLNETFAKFPKIP